MNSDNETRKSVGEYLKRIRLENGLSVRKLGKETGMAPAYISRIESGQYLFPAQYTHAFVKAMGMTGRELHEMYDVLALSRDNRYEDIDEYLTGNDRARNCIRQIMAQKDPDKVWDQILQLMNGCDRK